MKRGAHTQSWFSTKGSVQVFFLKTVEIAQTVTTQPEATTLLQQFIEKKKLFSNLILPEI